MNKYLATGRPTGDPEVKYVTSGDNQTAIARLTLAVERRIKRDGEPNADFVRCVAFGKTAEFIEKYIKKGTKIAIEGRIQTGNYQDKEGKTVYTTDVVIENLEFAESKKADVQQDEAQPQAQATPTTPTAPAGDGFMNIPEGLGDSGLPFNF